MILTCPECATRYFVDGSALGPEGRVVRCSHCTASWRALARDAEEEPPLALGLDPAAPVEATVQGSAAGPLPRAFREQVEAKRRTREAVAVGVVWAGLAATLALVLLGAALFRVDVVRLWPSTAGAFAAVHMPVNPTGFIVEQVHGAPGLTEGRLTMVVSGLERNVEAGARPAPALRVSLFDRSGKRLIGRVLPMAGRVASGEARAFQIGFIDPPAGAAQAGVDVIAAPAHRPVPAIRPRQPTPRMGLSAPSSSAEPPGLVRVETAKPLPASSPYALPATARPQADPAPGGTHG